MNKDEAIEKLKQILTMGNIEKKEEWLKELRTAGALLVKHSKGFRIDIREEDILRQICLSKSKVDYPIACLYLCIEALKSQIGGDKNDSQNE